MTLPVILYRKMTLPKAIKGGIVDFRQADHCPAPTVIGEREKWDKRKTAVGFPTAVWF
jgi:hypothetical protein